VLNLINNSLTNYTGTNSSNFTMTLSFVAQNRISFKTRENPGFFSQLLETRVLKFCPELEIPAVRLVYETGCALSSRTNCMR